MDENDHLYHKHDQGDADGAAFCTESLNVRYLLAAVGWLGLKQQNMN